MSGDAAAKPRPFELTQEDVDSLASDARGAAGVRKRLIARRPPAGAGRPAGKTAPQGPSRARKAASVDTSRAAPPPLSRAELTALRAGRLSAKAAQRLFVDAGDDAARGTAGRGRAASAEKPYAGGSTQSGETTGANEKAAPDRTPSPKSARNSAPRPSARVRRRT